MTNWKYILQSELGTLIKNKTGICGENVGIDECMFRRNFANELCCSCKLFHLRVYELIYILHQIEEHSNT